jgi:hypothetical protein
MPKYCHQDRYHQCQRGQGIVEYAGAIVVAATVIVASILVAPPSFNGMFNNVMDNVGETITVPGA